MKRKILAVMLAGTLALQGCGWVAAAEDEPLILEELEGIDPVAQDAPVASGEESFMEEIVSAEEAFGGTEALEAGEEKPQTVDLTVEELKLAEDPGYAQIQETEAAAAEAVEINEANFPDGVFREYVEQFDMDQNGNLETSEIEAVTDINVNDKNVGNLKGIEFFKSLTYLDCSGNLLDSLDVSSNKALTTLYCSGNLLSSLDVSGATALTNLWCSGNLLSSLDVSSNKALISLSCEENLLNSLNVSGATALTNLGCANNQLSSLDVSSNKVLTSLSCEENLLNSLNVSRATALTTLSCQGNLLSSLDASNNKALTTLYCANNQLNSLDVSGATALTELACANNQLSSLDVSSSKALTTLSCYGNLLNSLDVSSNLKLTRLDCSGNRLNSLDVSSNLKLTELSCSDNQLCSLDLSTNVKLQFASYYNNYFPVSAPVRVDGIWQMNLAEYVGTDNLDRVTLVSEGASLSGETVLFGKVRPMQLVYRYDTKAPTLFDPLMEVTLVFPENTECDVHDMVTVVDQEATCGTPGSQHRECMVCGYIEAVMEIPATGMHSFGDYVVIKEATEEEEGLRTRTCTVCGETESEAIPKLGAEAVEIVEINEANFPDEVFREYVKQFDMNQNGKLEAREIEAVTEIFVTNKNVENLKGIEFFKSLTGLYCYGNLLSSLDVSGNKALTTLYCNGNLLSSLDVSGNKALTTLNCSGNLLSSLDVSGATSLTTLSCSRNLLSSLDVSGATALTDLGCANNQLSSLDVSSNKVLTGLSCGENLLNSLNVSGATALTTLSCEGNLLSSLDASSNKALTNLFCANNQLSSLNVSGATALNDLDCVNNQLSGLDVSGNKALTRLSCANNQLSSLDVSSNKALATLSCANNQLSNLDVSSNLKLTGLDCSGNQLGSLDLSTNVKLQSVNCYSYLFVPAPVQVDGIWQMNLAEYIGSGNLDRVILEEGVSLSGETVLFGSVRPTLELVYRYDTKAPALSDPLMEVILIFSGNTECDVHDMVTVVDQEATCGKAGSQHRECTVCGYKEEAEEIPATGKHSFGDYVVIKEATAEEEGLRTRTCTVCGETESEAIPKLDPGSSGCTEHKMVTVVDQEATCGKAGSQHQECTVCGYKEEATEIPATGKHSFGDYVVTKEATVEEEGLRTRTCTVCGETESEAIPKLSSGSSGCTEHNMVTVVDQEATCGKAGSQHRECTVCGYKEEATEIPATGKHSFGDYVVTKEATVKKEGMKTRTCTICGETESTSVPKLTPQAEVNAEKVPLQVGQTTAKLEVSGLAKGDRIVSWESSDEKIVKVTKKGKLKAKKKAGTAVITVTLASGLKKEIKVTVKKEKISTKKISGLPKKVTLKKGKKLTLKPVITPITSQDQVTYATSDKKTATVTAKGVVKGKKAGTVKITVTSGKKKAVVTVKVKK